MKNKIKIKKIEDLSLCKKVTPDIIYNRYDLFSKPGEYEVIAIINGGVEKVIEYKITGTDAELGIWLTPITEEEMDAVLVYIKKAHPLLTSVSFRNSSLAYKDAKAHNNFRILFPKTAEEMRARVSPSSWHKMRRKNRRAEEKYGKMEVLEYTDGQVPDEIVEAFFEYKMAVKNRAYHMTPQEYLERYHVSDCYVVKFGDTIGAMRFSCEQGSMVNAENHAYNPELRDYSVGKYIFTHSLIREVEKGHSEIFLSGGDYEYKAHYGSIEETLYDGKVMLESVKLPEDTKKSFSKQLKSTAKKVLPDKMVKQLKKMTK